MKEELILKYLQNECSEEELQAINKWLSESEKNRKELFQQEVLYHSGKLIRYADNSFIQAEKSKLLNRLSKTDRANRKKILFRHFMQYAAVGLILLSTAVGLYMFNLSAQEQTVIADRDKVEQVSLPDGTKVWLNRMATLRYPKRFKGKTRKVWLDGEGYFEVATNSNYPFVVYTELMEVTVLGTVFNLYSPKGADTSHITLMEGEVQVRGNANEGMVILLPGQRAEINRERRNMYVKESSNALLDAVWHNGLIPFDKSTVVEIGKALEQIYGVQVHVDKSVNGTTYSGVLKNHDDIEQVLRSLKNSIPIEYKLVDNSVYISTK